MTVQPPLDVAGMQAEWLVGYMSGEPMLRLGPPNSKIGYRLSIEDVRVLADWLSQSSNQGVSDAEANA